MTDAAAAQGARAAGELRRIVVFGAGVSGWLAALAASRLYGSRREIVVVETPSDRSLQVGEATGAGFGLMVEHLGIGRRLFAARCAVTPRLATRFDGWRGSATTAWRPLDPDPLLPHQVRLLQHMAILQRLGRGGASLADVSPHVRLCRGGALPGPQALAALPHGVHLDADLCVQLARDTAARLGVRQVFGIVKAFRRDAETGDIAGVEIGGEREIAADLFIDTTTDGMLARAIGAEWKAWADVPCDRIVALPLPRDPPPACFSLSTAAAAGHIWRVPLVHRTGLGYCYSSAFSTEDDAAEALIAASGLARRRTADPRRIAFAPGRLTRSWQRNCLALGAAACRLDPILAPELGMVQGCLETWLAVMADGEAMSERRDRYNRLVEASLDAAHDAVRLAYATSARSEPFWEAARRDADTDAFAEKLRAYDHGDARDAGLNMAESCMLSGTGRFPLGVDSSDTRGSEAEAAVARAIRLLDDTLAEWQAAR